ncbi:unnamed protein product [Diamesa hyperborea]
MSLNSKSSPNLCECYVELLDKCKSLEDSCFALKDQIDRKTIEEVDEERIDVKLNECNLLKETYKCLAEEAELAKLKMQDLGEHYGRYRCKFMQVSSVQEEQAKKIHDIEQENDEIEQQINGEILKIRQDFVKRWKELDLSRIQYGAINQQLVESCAEQAKLKKELRKTLCEQKVIRIELEVLRESESNDVEDLKKFDRLRSYSEDLLSKNSQMESNVDCIKQKICEVQRELDLTREFTTSKLSLTKKYQNWSFQKLLATKDELERDIEKCKTNSQVSPQEITINCLSRKVGTVGRDLSEAELVIEKLKLQLTELLNPKSCCLKKKIKEIDPNKCKLKINDSQIFTVPGRDYHGSTIVKYKKPLEEPRTKAVATDYIGNLFIKT